MDGLFPVAAELPQPGNAGKNLYSFFVNTVSSRFPKAEKPAMGYGKLYSI